MISNKSWSWPTLLNLNFDIVALWVKTRSISIKSYKGEGIGNDYCVHAPCANTCPIWWFFGHFHLAPSVTFCMHFRSFPQLLQTCFLCFCVIPLFLSVGYCFASFVCLLSFSFLCLHFQFSFPVAEAFQFVFSLWGSAFVSFLLKYFKFSCFLCFISILCYCCRAFYLEFSRFGFFLSISLRPHKF